MSVRDSLIVNQNTGEEAKEIRNDVDKTGKSVDESITTAKEEILEKVGESDVKSCVKETLNSTVDTEKFITLDKMVAELWGGVAEYATAGTYQFTVPKNVRSIKVTACGGGGAGAAAYYSASCGGGGGSGGVAIQRIFTVTPLSTISITVGSGGIGTNTAASSTAIAANGNATVVGTLVTLAGGKGGGVSAGGASAGEGSGAGGTGGKYSSSGSTYSTAGSNGLLGKGGEAGGYAGGGGGSIGNGGNGGNQNGTKGGGGGGAVKSGGTGATSSKAGNGGDGYVKIEWGLAAV